MLFARNLTASKTKSWYRVAGRHLSTMKHQHRTYVGSTTTTASSEAALVPVLITRFSATIDICYEAPSLEAFVTRYSPP